MYEKQKFFVQLLFDETASLGQALRLDNLRLCL